MASLSSPLTLSAGASIRLPSPLPSPLPSANGQGFEVRPIPSVVPPSLLRDESQARQSRRDLADEERPDGRGQTRRTESGFFGPEAFGPGAFGGARLQQNPAQSFAPEDFVTSEFLAQILGQDLGSTTNVVVLHRDGPTLGADAYRRAGGEPTYYSEQPRILRIAV